MTRILGGSAGILITQALLWPHHHIVALLADVVCIGTLAGAGERKSKRAR